MQTNMTPTLNQISEVLPELPASPDDNFFGIEKQEASAEWPIDLATLYNCIQPQNMQFQGLPFAYPNIFLTHWMWDLSMPMGSFMPEMSMSFKGVAGDNR